MIRRVIFDYLIILVGTLITALAFNLFLVPNEIAAGGVGGIATISFYVFGFPVGATILVLNIPLFIAGIKMVGRGFAIKTIFSTIFLSVAIDVLKIPSVTDDVFLASVYGGIILGLGLGLVFRAEATTGGTDLAARLIHKYIPFISVGWVLFLIDFFVIAAAGVVFGAEMGLYALVALFISAKVIDLIQEGFNNAKAFIIISQHANQISEQIMSKLGRGVTSLGGKGMYTSRSTEVLLCIVGRTEVIRLKELIYKIDPKAFVILTDVREVLGEGFRSANV